MKDSHEVWAADLAALARVVSAISQPQIANEYQDEKGRFLMLDLGLSVEVLVSLNAVKYQAEARVPREYASFQEDLGAVPHE